jgi:hypothetical protein
MMFVKKPKGLPIVRKNVSRVTVSGVTILMRMTLACASTAGTGDTGEPYYVHPL